MSSLLLTKLFKPRVGSGLVSRPRLLARMDAGRQRGSALTLVVAPPGFGKTTLVSAWCDDPHEDAAVAWLSLGPGDNAPLQFWTYVIASLQTVDPAIGAGIMQLINSPQPPSPELVVAQLVNALARHTSPITLVLDDYHVINTEAIHHQMSFLLEHMPPILHIAITSRTEPALPLSRLRVNRQITEVRAEDLRFTREEAATFCHQTMQLDIRSEDVATLANRTEGWVAALQLAALSLQELSPHKRQQSTSELINAFQGSHHYVSDYLAEEVLNRQSPEIQIFLMVTSVLNELCGALCDALMENQAAGPGNGQGFLETLEAAQLFVIALDNERRWYRYHHLFAEFLRNRLSQQHPDSIPELHRRACAWYISHGRVREAIDHGIAAGDYETVVALVNEQAISILSRGDISTLRIWLSSIPDTVIRSSPELSIVYALVDLFAVRLEAMQEWLGRAHDNLPEMRPISDEHALTEAQFLWARYYAVQAYHVRLSRQDVGGSLDASERALELLSRISCGSPSPVASHQLRFWRDLTILNIGFARLAGHADISGAATAFQSLVESPNATENPYGILTALGFLGRAQTTQGHLHLAQTTYKRALVLAEELGAQAWSMVGYAYLGLAETAWHWNDLERAAHWLDQANTLSERISNIEIRLNCLVRQALIHHAQGDTTATHRTLEKLHELAHIINLPEVSGPITAMEIDFAIQDGDLARVRRWVSAKEATLDGDNNTLPLPLTAHGVPCVTLGRALVAVGRPEAGLRLARDVTRLCRERQAPLSEMRSNLAEVVALDALGQQDAARLQLHDLLLKTETENIVRLFAAERCVAHLISDLLNNEPVESTPTRQYLERVLAASSAATAEITEPTVTSHPHPKDIDTSQADSQNTSLGHTRRAPKYRTATEPPQSPAQAPVADGGSIGLVDPLTERELEILRYLATELSTPEIARELFVAASTVRTHVKRIYTKLDAHNRGEAVARANQLGIL